jgi:hypothetical protein
MTPDSSWRRKAVLELVESAFGDLPVPAVGSAGASCYPDENEECDELFRGRHWREIPPSDIPHEGSLLYNLQPEAFRFYLPAFMRAVVLDYERLDTLPDDLVSALTYRGNDRSHNVQAFRLFSPGQKAAVRRFLEYIRDEHIEEQFLPFSAEMALEKYWALTDRPRV